MIKRFFVLILALCCAFSFICQPVAAAATGVILTATQIGMAIAGVYGLVLASDAAYGAFGTLVHDSVVAVPGSPGFTGTDWWNKCLTGKIEFNDNWDAAIQKAVNAVAAKVTDTASEFPAGQYTYDFTLSSYTQLTTGAISSAYDLRGRNYTCSHSSFAPIYLLEYAFYANTSTSYPYKGCFGAILFSYDNFSVEQHSLSCQHATGYYFINLYSGWLDDIRFRKGCTFFPSSDAFTSYLSSLADPDSWASTCGGATAAYPTYGYDGVSLPDMDLTQPGLIAEDGTSTVSDLIAQLQSGAITWEDYIGTVAPGQTATITLTDAEGGSITYKLTNTGVGEAIGTGTGSGSETDETTPTPVVPPGSDTDVSVADQIKDLGASVGERFTSLQDVVQKIYDGVMEFFQSVKEYFASVLEKIQAIYDSVIEWLTAVRDAIVQFATDVAAWFTTVVDAITALGAQIVDAIKTWLQWLVEQILAGLQALGQTITNAFADAIAAVQAIPAEIAKAFSAAKPADGVNHFALDLSKYFPFCIPFDLYDFFMCLNAAPEAPVIKWEIPLPGGAMYPMEIDLSVFDSVAALLRRLELLLFCVGLAFKTRDLIKG